MGALLSALMLVWFVSGIVMIYHTFPKVTQADRIERMDAINPSNLLDIKDIIGDSIMAKSKSLALYNSLGNNIYIADSREILADSTHSPLAGWAKLEVTAKRWNSAPIARVDTLHKIDQWIPFGSYKKELPIYKIHYNDKQKHQLYVTSKDGRVIQYTSKDERFWAWVGAIPHWVYFTQLRQNTSLWIDVVVWLSLLGCVMVAGGIFMSLWVAYKSRKLAPYKKRWYRWHHCLGLLFGLITLSFTFSGMMSLVDIPQWMAKSSIDVSPAKTLTTRLPLGHYKLDYKEVITALGDVKQIDWLSLGDIPFYKASTLDSIYYIDARESKLEFLDIAKNDALAIVSSIYSNDTELEITLLHKEDSYYIGRRAPVTLPTWRVIANDNNGSIYYISPTSGSLKYIDNRGKLAHWLYPALHSLRFSWLVSHPIIWSIVMWTLMLGGVELSITGVVLGIKWTKQKIC